jgi:hypothetical protein
MNRITQLDPVQATQKTMQLFRQVKTKPDLGTRPPKAAVRKIEAILKLARSIIVRRKLSDADLNEARASGLADDEIVETIANVVLNIFSNYANEVARTGEDFCEAKRANGRAFAGSSSVNKGRCC